MGPCDGEFHHPLLVTVQSARKKMAAKRACGEGFPAPDNMHNHDSSVMLRMSEAEMIRRGSAGSLSDSSSGSPHFIAYSRGSVSKVCADRS